MITEDYVSFETAKLLKERGFDENTPVNYFVGDDKPRGCMVGEMIYHKRAEEDTHLIACPTIQTAMKWLRKVHNQIVVPNVRINDAISGTIDCYIVGIWYIPKNNGGSFCYISPTPYNGYSSYEEACEAGIKYCLDFLI